MSKVQNLMSLENHIFLQIFIHEDSLLFFSIFLKIYLCCFRFPCLLELNTHCLLWKISLFPCGFAVCCSIFHDSLNTYCLFQIFRWGFTTSFRFPWRSILPAAPEFLVYLNTHCPLFKISLNVHFLSQILIISWKTHHLLQMLKVWVRGGQSCCWHIFVDIFVQSPWHLNQFVDAINFLDFSFLVG